MALINYTKNYSDVSGWLGLSESSSGNYVKLAFTKQGNIITHGLDYTPWTWGNLSTSGRYWDVKYLPIDTTGDGSSSTLWTSDVIKQKINDSYLANSAMRFKGTIGNPVTNSGTTTYTINGKTGQTFPSSTAAVGDTYRITSAGTYVGENCEVGDLIICITAGSTTTAATWTTVQTNINGYNKNLINGVGFWLYSNNPETTFEIYAPTEAGTLNNVLVSNGSGKVPTFKHPSTIYGVGSVQGSLTIKGSGLSLSNSYNGSKDTTLSLIAATTSSLGGVSVDNSAKPTISVDTNGRIYLSYQNIVNVLGFDPGGTNSWRAIKVNGTEILSSDTSTPALNIVGSNKVTVSGNTNGTVTIDSVWREIKVAGESIGDKAVNFMPTGNCVVVKKGDQNTSTDDYDLGFDLAWYNISTDTYEL